MIFDESHYAKNHKAKRTQHCKEIAAGADMRLLLSGTPLLNRPQELMSQLDIMGRLGEFGGFWRFAEATEGGETKAAGGRIVGDLLDRLTKKTKPEKAKKEKS